MKDNAWYKKTAYCMKTIACTVLVLVFVLCGQGQALTDSTTLPQGAYGANAVSSDETIVSPQTSIVNFNLKSILEVPMQLLDLQKVRDAEDRVDRSP